YIEIDLNSLNRNHFTIKNKSKDVLFVDYSSSVAEVSNQSVRLISGETKMLHSDQSSPKIPIAPETSANISLYTDDEALSSILLRKGAKYRIALTKSGETIYLVVNTWC